MAARSQSPARRAKSPRAKKENRGASSSKTAPAHTHEWEFGGPIGAAACTLSLPVVILFLYYVCPTQGEGPCLPGFNLFALKDMYIPQTWSELWSWDAWWITCGWFALIVALERLLPCALATGVLLPNGERLQYRMNGHLSLWLSVFVVEHACVVGGVRLAALHEQYVQLATAAIVFSTLLSLYLYLSSFKKGALLAALGTSGNVFYDFWMGRELNPRIGSLDLKVLCELRPGMIGWLLLNLASAAKEREVKGETSLAMLLVQFFQGLYIWDAVYNEPAILTTMDVTTDGFGFMLCFGDLAWVPFTYSIPARYLATHDAGLSPLFLLAFALLGCFGFYLFRAANSQKNAFRTDPSAPEVSHLQFIETERGTRLLTSGWWGAARKINYTGDWLYGLSWSLLTGFGSLSTYYYPIYFAVLLVHRALRDDVACAAKYGADWTRYKQKVPYIFIPGVF